MTRDNSSIVEVADLRRRMGERRSVELTVTHEPLVVGSSHVDVADQISLRLTLESISTGISATGELSVDWHGTCRRCLDDVDGRLVADFSELFAVNPVEGETYSIGRDEIDVAELARDAVMMALPTAPLCREDCAGPSTDRFPVTVEIDEPAEPAEAPLDPRWAALDVLREPPLS